MSHLHSHGAHIIDDASQLPIATTDGSTRHSYILIPHTTPYPDSSQVADDEKQAVLVTDMWVERCLHRKQYEEPQARITNKPFRIFPLRCFETLRVCSTGFPGIDLLQTSQIVTLMGATYEEFFTPQASVLICNAVVPGHEKLLHAQVWGVPAVKADWLWDSIRRGESEPFGPYLVQPLRDPSLASRFTETPNSHDGSAKTRKSEKTIGSTDLKPKRPNEKPHKSENEEKRSANDTPSSSEQIQLIDPNPWSTTAMTLSRTNEDQIPDTNTTDDTAHSNLDDHSSHTLRPTSGPLHEISPNASQSKRSVSPSKPPSPSASAEEMPSPQKPASTASSSRPRHLLTPRPPPAARLLEPQTLHLFLHRATAPVPSPAAAPRPRPLQSLLSQYQPLPRQQRRHDEHRRSWYPA